MKSLREHPNREQLTAFLRGTLGSSDFDQIAEHVASCDVCCQVLREFPEDPFLVQLRDANTPVDVGEIKVSRAAHLPAELQKHPRYKIGKFLGAGGMGLVYQAEHRIMDRIVALKILHRDLISNPRVVKRFRQEVKAAAKLSHPNIVTAYDADQAGDVHFLVMEFVDGVSLDRLVGKRGPLEPAYACFFIRQAAKGLSHAFQAGMVHRDIKPQNLMLTRKGQVKILDFGLARLASETRERVRAGDDSSGSGSGLTKLGDVMGTPDYMAPEQATDASQADIRADIYSLGCTLYYLLTGQKPFSGNSAKTKVFAQKYAAPTPITQLRSEVPAELAAIIEKMMAKEAADRYQSPAEVVKALGPYAKPAPPPVITPKTSVPEPPVSKASPPTPVPTPPPKDAQKFLARCPFCQTRIRIPTRALGQSLPCPQCSSYFTAVPEEDSGQRG